MHIPGIRRNRRREMSLEPLRGVFLTLRMVEVLVGGFGYVGLVLRV